MSQFTQSFTPDARPPRSRSQGAPVQRQVRSDVNPSRVDGTPAEGSFRERRGRGPRRGPRPRSVLSLAAAEELLDLIADVEGDADESLLDECRAALNAPQRLSTVPAGFVAVGFPKDESDAVVTLIEHDTADAKEELDNAQARLADALRNARRPRL